MPIGTVRHQFEGFRQQGISGQYGDRFSKCFVTGGFSSAEVVIVDSRKIVVDERVRVDHLQSTAVRQNFIPLTSRGLKGGDRQNGTNPLTSSKEAMSDRLVNRSGGFRFSWKTSLKSRIDDLFLFLQISFDFHKDNHSALKYPFRLRRRSLPIHPHPRSPPPKGEATFYSVLSLPKDRRVVVLKSLPYPSGGSRPSSLLHPVSDYKNAKAEFPPQRVLKTLPRKCPPLLIWRPSSPV